MIQVGDEVELDLAAEINQDVEDLDWLFRKGVLPNKSYTVFAAETDEDYGEVYVELCEVDGPLFCGERFKLAAPFNLENE